MVFEGDFRQMLQWRSVMLNFGFCAPPLFLEKIRLDISRKKLAYIFEKKRTKEEKNRVYKQLSQQFVVCHLNEVMPQIFELLKIYLSIPVTRA